MKIMKIRHSILLQWRYQCIHDHSREKTRKRRYLPYSSSELKNPLKHERSKLTIQKPGVKMTAKKRKRFEKYLVCYLATTERNNDTDVALGEKTEKRCSSGDTSATFVSHSCWRGTHLQREYSLCWYSKSSWSSDLLKSSKNIGRSKQTMREQLKQAVLEEKAGLKISNDDVPLLVEHEVDEEALNQSSTNDTIEEKVPESDSGLKDETNPPASTKLAATATAPPAAPVIGSALKQSENGPALPLTKRKRKKKKVSRLMKILLEVNIYRIMIVNYPRSVA